MAEKIFKATGTISRVARSESFQILIEDTDDHVYGRPDWTTTVPIRGLKVSFKYRKAHPVWIIQKWSLKPANIKDHCLFTTAIEEINLQNDDMVEHAMSELDDDQLRLWWSKIGKDANALIAFRIATRLPINESDDPAFLYTSLSPELICSLQEFEFEVTLKILLNRTRFKLQNPLLKEFNHDYQVHFLENEPFNLDALVALRALADTLDHTIYARLLDRLFNAPNLGGFLEGFLDVAENWIRENGVPEDHKMFYAVDAEVLNQSHQSSPDKTLLSVYLVRYKRKISKFQEIPAKYQVHFLENEPFNLDALVALRALADTLDHTIYARLLDRLFNAPNLGGFLEGFLDVAENWIRENGVPEDHKMFYAVDAEVLNQSHQSSPDKTLLSVYLVRYKRKISKFEEIPVKYMFPLYCQINLPKDLSEEGLANVIISAANQNSDVNTNCLADLISEAMTKKHLNIAISPISRAFEVVASRPDFLEALSAFEWLGSYTSQDRPWNKLNQNQKIYWCIRKYVHKVEMIHPDETSSIIKMLDYYLNQTIPNSVKKKKLHLVYDRLQSEWDKEIQTQSRLSKSPLLPECKSDRIEVENVSFCEGRFNQIKVNDPTKAIGGRNDAYQRWVRDKSNAIRCPRTKASCSHFETIGKGFSHVKPDTDRPWFTWTLIEIFSSVGFSPSEMEGAFDLDIGDGDLIINKFAGVANRVNEISERLKCRGCKKRLSYNLKFAKHIAAYMTTLTKPCASSLPGCDKAVYINHCKGCRKIIDSRDSRRRDGDYYVCISCATGAAVDDAGTICPGCGKLRTSGGLSGGGRRQKCSSCKIEVELPPRSQYVTIDPNHLAP